MLSVIRIISAVYAACVLFASCGAPVIDEAKVEAAFFEAEEIASYFTGYVAGNVYDEGTVAVNGVRYDRFAPYATMAELAALVESRFDGALAERLLSASTVDGDLLYIEQDGVLYRFGGYIAQYAYLDAEREVTDIRAEDGVIYVDIASTFDLMDEPMTVSHTYTCVEEDGEYRFTGEFALPFTVVYDAWTGRDMQ